MPTYMLRRQLGRLGIGLTRLALSLVLGLTLAIGEGFPAVVVATGTTVVYSVSTDVDEIGICAGIGLNKNCTTLRAALTEAATNNLAGTNIITLPANATIPISPTLGGLMVSGTVTIGAGGTGVTALSGNGLSGPILTVVSGTIDLLDLAFQRGGNGGLWIQPSATVLIDRGDVISNTNTGIFNQGILTLRNSTLSGNSGGGIFNSGGTAVITNTTVTLNTGGPGSAGGIKNDSGDVILSNTILAGNFIGIGASGPNCSGAIQSNGNNLIGNDTGCTLIGFGGSDLVGTAASPRDPKLGPLQFNGGSGLTHALLFDSPAVDKGANCPTIDQRNASRLQGFACDIGAYELPIVSLSAQALTVSEAAGQAAFEVRLDAATPFTVTVTYSTTDLTARAGQDYTSTLVSVNLAPFSTTVPLTVPVLADGVYEISETLKLDLLNPVGAGLGVTQTATVTLASPDARPTVRFTTASTAVSETGGPAALTAELNRPSELPLQVNYTTLDGTARAAGDYTAAANAAVTFPPFATTQPVTVPIANDGIFENAETFQTVLAVPGSVVSGVVTPTLASPFTVTLTITNTDPMPQVRFSAADVVLAENAVQPAVSVQLTQQSELTTTVQYTAVAGTAHAGQDFAALAGTLTFAPLQLTQPLPLTLLLDSRYELTETFGLSLTSPVSATLGTPAVATVTVQNVDPLPTVSFEAASYAWRENDGGQAAAVRLSAPSEVTATVAYSLTAGSAAAGADYQIAAAGTLTFTPGLTTTTIPVVLVNDAAFEPLEGFSLSLSAPANAQLAAPVSTSVSITDDDLSYAYLSAVLREYNPFAEVEPNDDAAAATGPLFTAQNYFGRFNGNGNRDLDYFYFDLTAAGLIQVEVANLLSSAPGVQAQVNLYYGAPSLSNNKPVGFAGAPNAAGVFQIVYAPAQPGRYYVIVVMPPGYVGGTYTLTTTYP